MFFGFFLIPKHTGFDIRNQNIFLLSVLNVLASVQLDIGLSWESERVQQGRVHLSLLYYSLFGILPAQFPHLFHLKSHCFYNGQTELKILP